MTNDEFCKIDTAFYGDVVDNIKQIRLRSFTGEELKEYVEAAINYTHCCTEFADGKCKPMVNADWTYLRCKCGKRFEPKG